MEKKKDWKEDGPHVLCVCRNDRQQQAQPILYFFVSYFDFFSLLPFSL
jgi:hypothetical protein